jgi:hypothetical protein
MALTRATDRNVQYPNRFTLVDLGDGYYTIEPAPGTVTETGTPLNAAFFNPIIDFAETHTHDGTNGVQIDHGTLLGLSDNDHPQYVQKSGLVFARNQLATDATLSSVQWYMRSVSPLAIAVNNGDIILMFGACRVVYSGTTVNTSIWLGVCSDSTNPSTPSGSNVLWGTTAVDARSHSAVYQHSEAATTVYVNLGIYNPTAGSTLMAGTPPNEVYTYLSAVKLPFGG